MIQYQVDELDRKIIDKLTNDARASNRHLAQSLGVTEGTVRGRIKRLEAANLIRFTAVTNVASIGAPKVVLIGIQAQLSEVQTLCNKISAMREIGCVIAMAVGTTSSVSVCSPRWRRLSRLLTTASSRCRECVMSRLRLPSPRSSTTIESPRSLIVNERFDSV